MASGCVPILPVHGGASEYAQNGINSFLIDTTNINNALKVVDDIVNNKYDLAAMRTAAILTAQKYTIEKSSAATADVFREFKKSWEVQKRLHT